MDHAATHRGKPTTSWLQPFHLVAVAAVSGASILASRGLTDLDLYWHLRAGQEILTRHTTRGIGNDWVYAVDAHAWRTTEWLSEIVAWKLYTIGGFGLIRALTALLSVALSVAVMRAVIRPMALPSTASLGAVVVLTLASHYEDRPLLLSLVVVCLLAPRLGRIASGSHDPLPTWPLVVVTFLWAQFHGYWILLPAALALAAVCRLFERESSLLDALRPANQATLCAVAACVNPAGVHLLTAPFNFRGATDYIAEWKPTNIYEFTSWGMAVLIAAVVIAWGRSEQRASPGAVAWVLTWSVFSTLAMRNVPIAMLMIAPVVADQLARGREAPKARPARERRFLLTALVALVLLGIAGSAARLIVDPTVPRSVPSQLLAKLAQTGGEHRVLNSYNVAGQVIFFAGSNSRVALDGRADLSASLLPKYLQLLNATGNFQPLLDRLDPDVALVYLDSGIVRVLLSRGWRESGREAGYVLLLRPTVRRQ